ncbi:hypothetical protein BCR37DRAFT_6377 [Protomyces lactucae-debilis]|uniref:RRM domain-containing protein n=1 Tax=Protomyces lactucae-debilis TaxID=2754530 RepID=A0A1Y2FWN8_PROLT|nr:uncharacterized protein BCR37DRAFT_6377 [Protomyces lactucae-debilis]ORY87714.1 hypothetical protein BCR37DRAFT_6377 [Protomyces lactucae-debilis]
MDLPIEQASQRKRKRGHRAPRASKAAAQTTKRLFISGIAPSLSTTDLETRLATYGELVTPLQRCSKSLDQPRAFAHCTIRFPAAQQAQKGDSWAKLRKLSGTVLKGSKLLIEEAKPDWESRRRQDLARAEPKVPKPRQRLPKPATAAAKRDTVLLGVACRRARENKVVHDHELKKGRKRGWIKGKYGRAICVLKQDVPPGRKGKESGKPAVLKPTDPEAIQKLWGVLHRKSDQLTGYYDSDDETWHDRRGRIIHEQEITLRKPRIADQNGGIGGRVEIWDDEEEGQASVQTGRMGLVNEDAYTTAGSARPDYTPADAAAEEMEIDESALDDQLATEKTLAQSLLADMFGAQPETVPQKAQVDPALKEHDVADAQRDLKSLFKPTDAAASFALFDAGDESDEDTLMPLQQTETQLTAYATDDHYGSANKVQLGKDRGFGDLRGHAATTSKHASVFPNKSAAWPLLFVAPADSPVSSALLAGFPNFFPQVLPDAAKLAADWEASRQEATRDWKRKRREGAKRLRKSAAAAASAPRAVQS